MGILGEWLECDDGITRPAIRITVQGTNDEAYRQPFLIDSGADRTVLSGLLLHALGLPVEAPAPNTALAGIGGVTKFVVVRTALELLRDDGGTATIRGEFSAFTDPVAIDLSILGRDVLDNFDLILSRRRDEVVLLAPPHTYHVSRA